MDTVECLDKGYARLIDHMGDDLRVTNSARASFEKEKDEFDEKDEKLLRFLVREGHTSPLRQCFLTFEMRTPLMVARQLWKYIVSSNFGETTGTINEASRRYLSDRIEFYIPDEDQWRRIPENKKQGSGAPVSVDVGAKWTQYLEDICEQGERLFKEAQEDGICPEQARLFLPAYSLYVRYYWSASLQTVLHMLYQRMADDAQWEIQQYAHAIHKLARPCFPKVFEVFDEYPDRFI